MLNNLKTRLWLILLAGFVLLASVPAPANAAKTLELGQESGVPGDTVSVPVTLNDPENVCGIAFTIDYDDTVLEFAGIEQYGQQSASNGSTFKVPSDKVVEETSGVRYEYYNPYKRQYPYTDTSEYAYNLTDNSTLFYQVNDSTAGRVLVAGAAAEPGLAGPSYQLFNAKFRIKDAAASGSYYLDAYQSIINNPDAGYDVDTELPVLTGAPADEPTNGYYPTPTYQAELVPGKITVQGETYTLSGNVQYGSEGSQASSVDVLLMDGNSNLKDSTVTDESGAFSFSGLPAGDYRLMAYSNKPDYYGTKTDIIALNSSDSQTQTVTLQQAQKVSGELYVGTESSHDSVSGLKVQVRDGNTVLKELGVSNGVFNSGALPQGSYSVYAKYGNQIFELNASAEVNYWDLSLNSVNGTISGLEEGDTISVTAESKNASLTKTVTSNAADASGDARYHIPYLLPSDDYVISVAGKGYPVQYYDGTTAYSNATQVDLASGNQTAINFTFGGDTGSVSGVVTESDSALAGQPVYAYDTQSYEMVMATADSSGDYTLNLSPGTYRIFIITSGKVFYYSGAADAVQNEDKAKSVSVEKDASASGINLNVALRDKAISGSVVDDNGDPMQGVLLKAEGIEGQDSYAMDVTARDGSYELTGLIAGRYEITMDPIGTDYPAQVKTAQTGQSAVQFVIRTLNTLSGTITGSNSDSVQEAMIYLVNRETGQIQGGRAYFSDSSGKYRIAGIPNGLYTLEVLHKDYDAMEKDLSITSDGTEDVVLSKGAWIEGTVTDSASGDPLQNVLIIVSGATAKYDMTDRDGMYKVNGLTDGSTYSVTAKKKGYVTHASDVNASSSGETFNISMNTPANEWDLSGMMSDGSPLENVTAVVRSQSGDFKEVVTSNSAGEYLFTDLPQDTYDIIAVPQGDLPVKSNSTILLNSDMTVDFIWQSGTSNRITGTVTWSGSYVDVLLFDSNEDLVSYQTLESGTNSFEFNGLEGSGYKVLAIPSGSAGEFYNGATSMANAASVDPGADISIDLTH